MRMRKRRCGSLLVNTVRRLFVVAAVAVNQARNLGIFLGVVRGHHRFMR